MQTKELILNGKLLARYQANGNAVWIKPYIRFRFMEPEMTNHFLVALIGEIEETLFTHIGELQ